MCPASKWLGILQPKGTAFPGFRLQSKCWSSINRLESHAAAWDGAQSRVPATWSKFIDSTVQALPQSWSLAIYLQPELKIKPRAPKDVSFIKNKTIYIALLELMLRQRDILENVPFHAFLTSHAPNDHLDFSLPMPGIQAQQALRYLGLDVHMRECG